MNKIQIIPAIDLRNGKCVRLVQGDYQQETIYNNDPMAVAEQWQNQGAELIHIVDLDGAKQGELVNIDIVKKIVNNLGIAVEFGGGIRTLEDVKILQEIGVRYPIIGTKALENEEFLVKANAIMQGQLVVGIDAKNGQVAVNGWTKISAVAATDLAKKMELINIKRVIYTDILTDGAFTGPNIAHIKTILQQTSEIAVTVSGGVSCEQDVVNVGAINNKRVFGVVIGKALYENKINLKEIINLKV
jgi:phosphoribosylformimino-5-aminoimidazole carboxamide ribotide isomerase